MRGHQDFTGSTSATLEASQLTVFMYVGSKLVHIRVW